MHSKKVVRHFYFSALIRATYESFVFQCSLRRVRWSGERDRKRLNEKNIEKDKEKNIEKDKEKNIEKDKEKNIEKDKEENTEKDQEKKIVIFHHSLGRVQWGDERDNCTQLNFLSG